MVCVSCVVYVVCVVCVLRCCVICVVCVWFMYVLGKGFDCVVYILCVGAYVMCVGGCVCMSEAGGHTPPTHTARQHASSSDAGPTRIALLAGVSRAGART